MKTGRLIWWFDELVQEDNETVGEKYANLGKLSSSSFQAPLGSRLN